MNAQKVFCPLMIFVLYLFFLCIPFVFLFQLHQKAQKQTSYPSQQIDWEAMYPFENATQEGSLEAKIDKKTQVLHSLKNALRKVKKVNQNIYERKTKIQQNVNDSLLFSRFFSSLYCKMAKCLGMKKISGKDAGVFVLDDGFFSFSRQRPDNSWVKDSLLTFQNYIESQGGNFLFLMFPYKFAAKQGSHIYEGYTDFLNQEAVSLSLSLKESALNFLDLQQEAKDAGLSMKDVFFKTDHHWMPFAAFWGAKELSKVLNFQFDFDIDSSLFQKERYDIVTHPKSYLGSQGKKVTTVFAQVEDFSFFCPNFKTNLCVQVPSLLIDKTGEWKDTIVDMQKMENVKDVYKDCIYEYLGYGDVPFLKIQNNLISKDSKNCKKVLIIKDSFADIFVPYLALTTKEVISIDLRHFEGNIRALIEEYSPDLVIMATSGECPDKSCFPK